MAQLATSEAAGRVGAEIRAAAMHGEPDRYLAATLAARDVRDDLAALAAFAAEVARIPAVVSEPMLGDIRLQWWRDALEAGRAGEMSGHPVADALAAAMRRHDLPADTIEAVIDARELDLSGGLPQDDAGLAAYLKGTEGNLFALALRVLGANAGEAERISLLAGRAYGLARGLGRLPMQIHNGGVLLPAGRLRIAGVDPALLSSTPAPPAVHEAVERVRRELEAEARLALGEIRSQWPSLEARLRPALLPLAMVEPYFRAQSGLQVLVEPVVITPLRRVLRIGLAHLTGRL